MSTTRSIAVIKKWLRTETEKAHRGPLLSTTKNIVFVKKWWRTETEKVDLEPEVDASQWRLDLARPVEHLFSRDPCVCCFFFSFLRNNILDICKMEGTQLNTWRNQQALFGRGQCVCGIVVDVLKKSDGGSNTYTCFRGFDSLCCIFQVLYRFLEEADNTN